MARFLIAVKLHSKASVERVRLVLDKLAKAGDEVHVAYVLLEAAPTCASRLHKVQQQLEAKLKPVLEGHPAVSLHVHVLPVSHPFSSYADPNVTKARALCAKAAALSSSVMVIGGSSTKVRDAAPAAFFIGHSTGYWMLQGSPVPIFFARENRLSMPADCFSTQLSAAGQANHVSSRASLVAASA